MTRATATGPTAPLRDLDNPGPVRPALLTEAVRVLAAFAGLGAGILSFGISSTLLTSTAGPWTITGPVAATAWGAALMVWSVQSLRRGAPAWPGAVVRVVPAAVALHLGAVAHGIWWAGESPPSLNGTALTAAALELILLGAVGWLNRRTTLPAGPAMVRPAAGPLLIVTFAAALLVAAITTPGLAATAAGEQAVPHGEHGSPHISPPSGHHH